MQISNKMKWILSLILVGLVITVLVQNAEVVTIRFLFWRWSMSGIIFFLIFFITGLVAGFCLGRLLSKKSKPDELNL